MPAPMIFLAVIGFVVVGFAAYAAWLGQKKRREELAALARELGWSFDPGHDTYHDEKFAQFEIFRRGHSRAAYNTLEGSMRLLDTMCPVRMGDFTYKVTSGSGKIRRTTTYRFSYVIVDHPFRNVPELLIRPEGVFDKLAGAHGGASREFVACAVDWCRARRGRYHAPHGTEAHHLGPGAIAG